MSGLPFRELLDNHVDDSTDDAHRCLITDDLLEEDCVVLECGHRFNYAPLLEDIKRHKQQFNRRESDQGRLTRNQIRCPYCRHIQNYLLPYRQNYPMVNGVNYLRKTNIDTFLATNPCSICSHTPSSQISIYNAHCPSQPINYGDTHWYCSVHLKQSIREHQRRIRQENNASKALEKKKAREEAKLAKKKAREEAKHLKTSNLHNKPPLEPITTQVPTPLLTQNMVPISKSAPKCAWVMKLGKRKGELCRENATVCGMCKKHYKMKMNNSSPSSTGSVPG